MQHITAVGELLTSFRSLASSPAANWGMIMASLQELQEKRKKLGGQLRTMRDAYHANGKKWKDTTEETNWRSLNTDYDQVKSEMAVEQATEEVDSRMKLLDDDDTQSTQRSHKPGMDDTNRDVRQNRRRQNREGGPSVIDEHTRVRAFNGWARSGLTDLHREEVEAMRACRMSSRRGGFEIAVPDSEWMQRLQETYRSGPPNTAKQRCLASKDLRDGLDNWYERRNLSAITANAGGILVPASFIRQMEINKLAFGGMLQVATIQRTTSGELMTMPTADDTSNTGARIGENTSVGSSVDPSFGGVQWTAYKYHSKPVKVPHELLEDAQYDLPGFLSQALPMRIARKQNTDFTVGSGANCPKGIVTCASSGRTATSATAISFDDVIYLEHSIDPAYRDGTGYMCHDNIVLALRLLKDLEGRYLWSYGVTSNSMDTLNGKPLTVNQDMDSTMASTKKTLLYGQLGKYIIRQAGQSRFYRLTERFRDDDQDGFMMFERADGNLLHAGTVPVKYLVH